MPAAPSRRDIDGRPHLNRALIAELTGVGEKTQRNLHSNRAENGHPLAHRVGREAFFPERAVLDWYGRWAERKAPRRGLPDPLDADPDELLGIAEATRMLGYTSESTIRAYVTAARNEGYFPDPDHVVDRPNGHIERFWRRATLRAFADRPGTTGQR